MKAKVKAWGCPPLSSLPCPMSHYPLPHSDFVFAQRFADHGKEPKVNYPTRLLRAAGCPSETPTMCGSHYLSLCLCLSLSLSIVESPTRPCHAQPRAAHHHHGHGGGVSDTADGPGPSINCFMTSYLGQFITPISCKTERDADAMGIKSYPAGVTAVSALGVLS